MDHGLRPESGAQARQTGAWLGLRGIDHRVLAWQGPKPATGIQAAARIARYDLLAGWCRGEGVLHLLLGHHRDDQAETVMLRAERRSGSDGLAGMAAVREIEGLRLLRPLLGVPKQRLIATLRAAGQDWIDDPSNRAPGFARARLRQGVVARATPSAGTARAALDQRAAAWLARHARIDPAGFVGWRHEAFLEAPPEIARRALQQALATVGGRDYPPRSERLERLQAALSQPIVAGRTLAGCRVLRWREDLLICREPAAIAPALPLVAGVWQRWDRRFLVRWHGGAGPVIRALGRDRGDPGVQPLRHLPAAVRTGLASVWLGERLLAVAGHGTEAASLRFCPLRPLAGAPFAPMVGEGRLRPVPYQRIARDHTFASI